MLGCPVWWENEGGQCIGGVREEGLGSKGDLAAMQNSKHQGAGLAMCGEPGWELPCCTLDEKGYQILDLFWRWNH